MPPTVPADRICATCQAVEGKYKCPRCMVYTCCLACTKKHRDEHPPEEEKPPAPPAPETAAEGTSSIEQPDEFNKIFAKYPQLATYLHQIADETEPPTSMTPSPDYGDKIGFKRKQQRKPWTREVGMQNALQKLRHLREQDSTGGLKEFCELVRMTNAQKAQEEARRLEAQRDAEAIAQMIREERT